MKFLVRIRPRLLFGSVLAAFILGQFDPNVFASTTINSIPPIAHIAGVMVGVDTIGKLSRRYGPGVCIPGQHPTGGRSWTLSKANMILDVDGFYYDKQGRIVDSVSLSLISKKTRGRGFVHTSPELGLAFMGSILPGMKEDTILKALQGRLPSPSTINDASWNGPGRKEIGWHLTGKSGHNALQGVRFTYWDAKLLFQNKELIEIDVECG